MAVVLCVVAAVVLCVVAAVVLYVVAAVVLCVVAVVVGWEHTNRTGVGWGGGRTLPGMPQPTPHTL